jgi:hypothetical protein
MKRKGNWKLRDVAQLFDCSVRSIQDRVYDGELKERDLPGGAKFLDGDLEEFLRNSVRKPRDLPEAHTDSPSDNPRPLGPRRGRPRREGSAGILFSKD